MNPRYLCGYQALAAKSVGMKKANRHGELSGNKLMASGEEAAGYDEKANEDFKENCLDQSQVIDTQLMSSSHGIARSRACRSIELS